MKKSLRILFLGFALLSTMSIKAQYNRVLSASNFGGVSNVNYNPAIADNRMKFDLNLLSLGFDAGNNYVGVSNKPFLDRSLFESESFDQFLKERVNGKNKNGYVAFNTQLPLSFMVGWGKNKTNKNAIAITSNFNSLTNVDNISETLARASYYGLGFKADSITGFNGERLAEKNVAITSLSWMDIGFTYSRVVYDKGDHFLKVGGTIKALVGVASAYLYSDNANYLFNDFDSLNIYNSDVKFGHSRGIEFLGGDGFEPMDVLKGLSYGAAGDIGAVYEWRPNKDKYKYTMDCKDWWYRERDKYKLAVGFSVIDIGAIKFKKSDDDRNFRGDIRNWLVKEEPWQGIASFDSIISSKFAQEDDKGTFTIWLPTRFNLYVDYNIWKGFGVNLNTTISPVLAKSRNQVHYPTSVTLTPKYDHKWAGVYIPISYDSYGNFSAGAGLRVGPVFVTSSSLITLFAKQHSFNFNIQAGLKITIPNSVHRDRDKDGVSNKLDKCKKEKGNCESKGCPDKDGDGIVDSKDKCPDDKGLAFLDGCPDRDGDSIADINDSCPDVKGLRALYGCPDADGDGIADKYDECPQEKGTKELKGCPDRDNDRVADKDDACPDLPGDKAHAGCPDSDGDGIYDNEDKCPREKGPKENNGCPWPDTDGDKVLDKDDACPTVFGVIENKGCPQLAKKEVETLKYAFSNLEFETGKDVIKSKSFASLNGLAKLLIEKANYGLKIEGHTDNTGNADKNQILSEKRAAAVKAYLVKRGVDDNKLSTAGFGQTKPIADNKTNVGRQKNRRVEMNVEFK
jgi:outer membrane protein OmpA-like peptidoglycan-associated protein